MLGHGYEPKDNDEIPYKLTVSNGRDGNITVTISGAEFLTSTEFKGFIIQVTDKYYIVICDCDIKSIL